ncbi:BQ5605_C006g04131 [Microbotryum silenes-dioicae]|uniref:BQ5605_C006g04131 protein n=1 Tax=Microbotryum silenes-dioicae TaxID=796604 RepID=A0A2X0P8F9_9BASI|nr:BQ5605_C006g04131 [Microbotryum silenes-dioicae]
MSRARGGDGMRYEEQEGERWRLSLNRTHRMSRKAAERRGVKPEAEGHVPGCFDGKWVLGERGRNGLSPRGLSPVL